MMKIHTLMPGFVKPFYREELLQAKNAFDKMHYRQSWRHLERAHILVHSYPFEHTEVHWKMLGFGIKIKNRKRYLARSPGYCLAV